MRLQATLLTLSSLQAIALAGKVQKAHIRLPSDASVHRNARHFHDELFSLHVFDLYFWSHCLWQPVDKTWNDGRNGFGASVVETRCHADYARRLIAVIKYIMGLTDLFTAAVNFSASIDFSISHTTDTVSVFETTIRYLGGLLSAYELSNKAYPVLLEQATTLCDKLAYAWVGNNDVPFGFLDFATNSPVIDMSNIAEAGTITLEFATLSKHTGNDTYRQLAEKSVKHIASLAAPLPGLAAQGIDPATGQFVGGYVLLRIPHQVPPTVPKADAIFSETWELAVDSSIKHLLATSTVGHKYLTDYDSSKRIRYVGSHLACFHAGNWIFGGRLLDNQTIFDIGMELNEACWNTYASTATGFGPEVFAYASAEGNFTGHDAPTEAQLTFYNEHGFYLTDADYYYLRPEVLESNFYAFRATGDPKYLDRAVAAITSINTYLVTTVGYAGIWEVDDLNSDWINDMQSFWLAEVLKYLYLTFDDPSHINLDEWVFNTEAQPFKAPPSQTTWGGHATPQTGFTVKSGPPLPAVSPNSAVPALKINDSF
ncbi:glycoside hydrolase family 47 protein [Mycena floridula]|nr:glycoside hydrolase family 47 protein [Mycena floridula]